MQMMVAVDSLRWLAIQPFELPRLSLKSIFKTLCQARVKRQPGQRVASQIRNQFALVFAKYRGTVRGRKGQTEIEMQSGVNSMLARELRGPLGIGHEYHGADGRHCAAEEAVQHSSGRLFVAPPIVR